MSWTPKVLKKVEPKDFWKAPNEIIHKSGLKVFAWGETDVSRRLCALPDEDSASEGQHIQTATISQYLTTFVRR